jgi:carotenoid phi-ring synthase / carotenoid chi-ring synthase
LATMFHIYFLGSSEGLIFDVANDNFNTALWQPLQQYLIERGVRFHLGSAVSSIDGGQDKTFRVRTDADESLDADAVVLATDVTGLQRIVTSSPGLGDDIWRARVKKLRTAPPFMVHRLWLDRPVAADRAAFLGTAGHEPLDNISVLDRYERQAAGWVREHGGSVVELHSYAVQSAQAQTAMLSRLHELYPETAGARVVHEQMLYRRDCPLFAPGSHAQRPGVSTPMPGLMLAGDGVRIDLPVALMERAATTGWTAANQLLTQWGLAGHTLYTVPTQGRSALLRFLAGRERRPRP